MADQQNQPQMRPASKSQAPDPSTNYERAHPEREAGMGSLDAHMNTPTDDPDRMEHAVKQRQANRQINADEVNNGRATNSEPDHSMNDEEPRGEDLAPTDIHDPRQQRHPRTGGKGGTPDAGEPRRKG